MARASLTVPSEPSTCNDWAERAYY